MIQSLLPVDQSLLPVVHIATCDFRCVIACVPDPSALVLLTKVVLSVNGCVPTNDK